jgi:hypothetical protein
MVKKSQFWRPFAPKSVQQAIRKSPVSIAAQQFHEDLVSQDRMPLELSSLRIRQNRDSF